MAYLPPTLTPAGAINHYPCIECLPEKELLATLAMVFYSLNHAGDHTVATMVADVKCWCVSDHQMLVAIVSMYLALAIANGYFNSADEAAKTASCLTCADPHVLKAIITKALVEYGRTQWPQAG